MLKFPLMGGGMEDEAGGAMVADAGVVAASGAWLLAAAPDVCPGSAGSCCSEDGPSSWWVSIFLFLGSLLFNRNVCKTAVTNSSGVGSGTDQVDDI